MVRRVQRAPRTAALVHPAGRHPARGLLHSSRTIARRAERSAGRPSRPAPTTPTPCLRSTSIACRTCCSSSADSPIRAETSCGSPAPAGPDPRATQKGGRQASLFCSRTAVRHAGRPRNDRPSGLDSTHERKAVKAPRSRAISYVSSPSEISRITISSVMMSYSLPTGPRREPTSIPCRLNRESGPGRRLDSLKKTSEPSPYRTTPCRQPLPPGAGSLAESPPCHPVAERRGDTRKPRRRPRAAQPE